MELRHTGIDLIGDAPWGTHFCQFYANKEDLADLLVPYFKAGLEQNEHCMWVTSPPLECDEAWQRLARGVRELERYRQLGRIEVIPYTEWYLRDGVFDQARVLDAWVERLETALARGCAGLRLSGNTFWLEKADWRSFAEYEAAVDAAIGQHRMLAVCTYAQSRCDAAEVADVVRNHEFALLKREGVWERIESRKRVEAAVQRERQRLFDVLETLPAMICLLTPDHRVAFTNRAFRERFGEPGDRPCHEYLFGLSSPCEFCKCYEVLATGRPHRWERGTADGASVIDAHDLPFTDVDGSPLILKMEIDITARKQAEKALREGAARYRNLFDTSSEGILIQDLQGRILEANRAYCQMSGYAREEIVGMPISALEVGEPPSRSAARLEQVGREEGQDRYEARHRRKDGSLFDVEIAATDLERDGQVAIFIRDITERKRLEAETARHLAGIKETSEAKDLFFNILSHELRTPLTAMLNAVEVLKLPDLSRADLVQMSGVLERNVTRQVRLIDDLLDLSRIMRKKVEMAPETLDLREVVAGQLEAAEPEARKAQLTLSAAMPEQPVPVLGDGARLGQVVANLLSNAIKYTEPGGAVRAKLSIEGKKAVLRLEDTGIGISPEMLRHLFEPFRQADTSLTRKKGGLGIGLTVARSLAELHSGTLTAASAGLGQGSVFVLRLPLGAVVQTNTRAAGESKKEAQRSGGLRILLVEDDADVRESMTFLLKVAGHKVVVATDGTTALELARQELPDVALIDIGLPDIDGYEVARRLRSDPTTRDLWLIAVTGYATKAHRERATQAGFDLHLAKPVETATLRKVLGGEGSREHPAGQRRRPLRVSDRSARGA